MYSSSVYIHDPHEEIGLYHNFWPLFVANKIVHKNVVFDIPLMKEIYKKYDNEHAPCNDDPDYSYGKCIVEWARDKYLSADCQESKASSVQIQAINCVCYSLLGATSLISD